MQYQTQTKLLILYLWLVRILIARILFCFAVGPLFIHQSIAHHHHEDPEIILQHQDDDHHSDGHTDHFPQHQVDHIFSFENSYPNSLKTIIQEVSLDLISEFSISLPVQFRIWAEHPETGPPPSEWYRYFSLRAPPVV